GKSPYGLYDMSGNVWEWVDAWYKPHPNNPIPSEEYGEKYKIAKGGSWYNCLFYNCGISAPSYNRAFLVPLTKNYSTGIRCVKDVGIESAGGKAGHKDQPLRDQKSPLLRNMILVPAGEFIMGTDKTKEKPIPASYGLKKTPYENEQPQRTISLDAFYIDRYEVTNIEYQKFVDGTQTGLPGQLKDLDLKRWGLYPIASVSWLEADSYCKWKGKRLPTEAEWEKSARGTDGRRYPWGDKYDGDRTNNKQKGLAPIGYFKGDVSPYGVYDLAGNVAEWVESWYKPYPGNEVEDPDFGEKYRVIRGGSWGGVGHYILPYYARTGYRNYDKPEAAFNDIGFRCALSANSENLK
ncbi:MAG: formylglycine-generating enzyme family protein, partial [Nitrospiria bacterium]